MEAIDTGIAVLVKTRRTILPNSVSLRLSASVQAYVLHVSVYTGQFSSCSPLRSFTQRLRSKYEVHFHVLWLQAQILLAPFSGPPASSL